MAQVKKLSQLRKKINERITDSLQNEVSETIKDVQHGAVQEFVYDVYDPQQYVRRRDNGGLQDKENMKTYVESNGFRIRVRNETKRSTNFTGEYLAPLVELGQKKAIQRGIPPYEYGAGSFLDERRFLHETRASLRNNKLHVNAMRAGLNRRGIRTK